MKKLIWTSAIAMLAAGQLAVAQESGTDAAEPVEQTRSLQKVVITARKQQETSLEAPLSVTAFTSDTLINEGIGDPDALALRTPGMTYGNFGDSKLSPTSLRGVIGGAGSAGADPAVAYYLDEVFLGQGVGAAVDLFDLERVEVLRGPQGTLFGRNAIGGAVSYTTARPTDEFEARLEAEAGNYDYYRIGAVVSGPLVKDTVSGRLAFQKTERGGLSDNVVLGQEVNTEGSWSARGQLLFNLGVETEWLLTADYKEIDQEPLIFETLKYIEGTTFVSVLDAFAIERNADPFDRKVYADQQPVETAEIWGASSTFTTTISGVDITNITSYREHDYFSRTDTDRSALSWLYDGDPETTQRFSNEFRLNWSSGDLDWILGTYYYDQEASNLSFIEIGSDLADLLGAPEAAGGRSGSDARMDTRSIAAFASMTWNVSEKLDVTLGARYTDEEKKIDYSQSDPFGLLGGDFSVTGSDSWSEVTPTANVRYRFTPETIGYVTVSSGFKSGGYNDALGDANGISFDPETLWNYEVGLKGELFDGQMQASLAVFYMDWTDIQITTDNPNTPLYDPQISNAGAAHSTGVELEVLSRVTDYLTVGLNAALQEAEFDEGILPDGTPLDKIPYAPDYTLNLNADYEAPLTQTLDWFVGGSVLARGESYLTQDNQADGRVESYTLYNLSAGIAANDGSWRFSIWGENLGDEEVKQRLFDLSGTDVVGQKFVVLGDPETYGVRLVVRY
nr:TonB-dependent receptor [uncultured Hyphomonas sp.]